MLSWSEGGRCSWIFSAKPTIDMIFVWVLSGKHIPTGSPSFQSPCLLCLADFDECGEQSCCEQNCTNYPGGYECYCSAGYRLNSDGCSCDGMFPPVSPNVNGTHFYPTEYLSLLNLEEIQFDSEDMSTNMHNVFVWSSTCKASPAPPPSMEQRCLSLCVASVLFRCRRVSGL